MEEDLSSSRHTAFPLRPNCQSYGIRSPLKSPMFKSQHVDFPSVYLSNQKSNPDTSAYAYAYAYAQPHHVSTQSVTTNQSVNRRPPPPRPHRPPTTVDFTFQQTSPPLWISNVEYRIKFSTHCEANTATATSYQITTAPTLPAPYIIKNTLKLGS